MFILYDFLYIIYAIFYLPLYYARGKGISAWAERFAFYRKDFIKQLGDNKTIWLHAVSVGEILSAEPLLKALKKEFPQYRLVISVTTSSGRLMAERLKNPQDLLIYFPFDLSLVVKKAVLSLKPALFIAMEKEFWPNLVNRLHRDRIPMAVINGRMSEKSLAKYKKVKFLIKNSLNQISLFCMQTNRDALRIIELGVNKNKVKITGNLKFDAVIGKEVPADKKEKYYNQLILSNRRLLVAGSTHKGEEEAIVKTYNELKLKDSGWVLLIAPRHLERVKEVEALIGKYDFKSERISTLARSNTEGTGIYILDIMGELKTFYSLADIVFIGGSLVSFGGHNLIEPAYFKKAIIFGEHVFNFQDIADELIIQQAAIMVKNTQELKDVISSLANNRDKIAELGQKAKKVVASNLGATEKNIREIKEIFK